MVCLTKVNLFNFLQSKSAQILVLQNIVATVNVFENFGRYVQCDQIALFLKGLVVNFLIKEAQTSWYFLANFAKRHFWKKNCCLSFWITLGNNWATFYLIIWSHCIWILRGCPRVNNSMGSSKARGKRQQNIVCSLAATLLK